MGMVGKPSKQIITDYIARNIRDYTRALNIKHDGPTAIRFNASHIGLLTRRAVTLGYPSYSNTLMTLLPGASRMMTCRNNSWVKHFRMKEIVHIMH